MQRMRARSLPALLFLSEPACRSVGRRPEAGVRCGKATRPQWSHDSESDSPLAPAQAPESPYFPRFEAELAEMRENGRVTAPDSPRRVVSACDTTPDDRQLMLLRARNPEGFSVINATQSLKPRGVFSDSEPETQRGFQ